LYEDFWKMIFWLVLKLEISYRVIISWRILVSFGGFFEHYIFCRVKYLSVNGKATVWLTHSLFVYFVCRTSVKIMWFKLFRHFIVALLTICQTELDGILAPRGDSSVRVTLFLQAIYAKLTIPCFRNCRQNTMHQWMCRTMCSFIQWK
jgi:hypothetical protein